MSKRYVNTVAAKKWFKTPGKQRSKIRHDKKNKQKNTKMQKHQTV